MKEFRKRFNRFQFISQFGFDKHRIALGMNIMYLPGMKIQEINIDGFWSIEVDFVFGSLTMNITDKE